MKTNELTGAALDWAVAKCEGWEIDLSDLLWPRGWGVRGHAQQAMDNYKPSTDWSQGGPIIEREKLGLWRSADEAHRGEWACATDEWMDMNTESDEFLTSPQPYHGATPLIAAMRCYVASKLGDEIDVPKELT